MRSAIRLCVGAVLLTTLIQPVLAVPTPFFSAGVEGAAYAVGVGGLCAVGHVESYRTFQLGAGLAHAEGRATSVNACDPLAGSSARSAADLASGTLHVFSGSSRYQPGVQFYSLASAYFSDDVFLYFGSQKVDALAFGLFGEIRLDIHGTGAPEPATSMLVMLGLGARATAGGRRRRHGPRASSGVTRQ